MSSKKPKLFAYVPPALAEQIADFRAEHGYRSDSQALIAIVEQFFAKHSEPPLMPHGSSYTARLDKLEAKVGVFSSLLREILQRSELYGDVLASYREIEQDDSELKSELYGNLMEILDVDLDP